MSTRCLLCWPFWQFRRLYRKRRPRRLSSSLFPSGISDNNDGRRVRLHRAPVQCSPRLREARHGEGSEQTMPLLLRILRIQLGIRQQQRQVLQEVRQLKHKMSSAKKQGATRRRPSTLLRGGCQGLVIAVGAGSGASEKHLLWSSPMIPTLRVQIIGCSRRLASCPATAARALTAPLSLCPQRNLTCSRAGLF
ncbi:uncharacterized protein LOC142765472 isoform X2 [Rhipicephalus microplus]|uniref:uncharacterized protein LOC142765472 isoform X2 n=1 Tax=Rhipicephalus microplus TaxID=6941 RepID=UPI003F6BB64C